LDLRGGRSEIKPFGETCEALGVIFDLSSADRYVCKVSNTTSRVEEISGEIQRSVVGDGIHCANRGAKVAWQDAIF
jgi:hypothetical protein